RPRLRPLVRLRAALRGVGRSWVLGGRSLDRPARRIPARRAALCLPARGDPARRAPRVRPRWIQRLPRLARRTPLVQAKAAPPPSPLTAVGPSSLPLPGAIQWCADCSAPADDAGTGFSLRLRPQDKVAVRGAGTGCRACAVHNPSVDRRSPWA